MALSTKKEEELSLMEKKQSKCTGSDQNKTASMPCKGLQCASIKGLEWNRIGMKLRDCKLRSSREF